jgi:hypothetical protein
MYTAMRHWTKEGMVVCWSSDLVAWVRSLQIWAGERGGDDEQLLD